MEDEKDEEVKSQDNEEEQEQENENENDNENNDNPEEINLFISRFFGSLKNSIKKKSIFYP